MYTAKECKLLAWRISLVASSEVVTRWVIAKLFCVGFIPSNLLRWKWMDMNHFSDMNERKALRSWRKPLSHLDHFRNFEPGTGRIIREGILCIDKIFWGFEYIWSRLAWILKLCYIWSQYIFTLSKSSFSASARLHIMSLIAFRQ